MMILSTEADGEKHAEAISRVRSLVEDAGGTVDDVAEWGRRAIAYPVQKQSDGVYVIITCQTSPEAIDEIGRVMAISRDVVLRAMPFRLSEAELATVQANGVPEPVDERPEREERPRGGRRSGGGGRRRDR
ncbi:MAG: 30S ribosomal protein S6 [Thermoleophilia bacterium]